MSDHDPKIIEKAVRAAHASGCMAFYDYDARAVLAAVADDLRAQALREAAAELPGFDGIRTHGDAARWLRNRADRMEGNV